MKFGNNLIDLSVAEWRSHNLDYNELKGKIRTVTQSKSKDLKPLYAAFRSSFDQINLFVATKHAELARRLDSDARRLQKVSLTNDIRRSEKKKKYKEIIQDILEIAATLKDLSQFILIQKLASQKIFKKFIKYYPDSARATRFVARLKDKLKNDEHSFVGFDITELTERTTNFLQLAISMQKELNVSNQLSLPSTTSISSHLLNNFPLDEAHAQQAPKSPSYRFDLTACVKKDFRMDFLLLNDPNNVNDIKLNLNIYLNLDEANDHGPTHLSYIYLQGDNLVGEPCYIITEKGSQSSIIVAFMGGLRKNSYCILPNSLIEVLLSHLMELSPSSRYTLDLELSKYEFTSLTRFTINTIIEKGKTPKMKMIFKRSRYVMSKGNKATDNESEEYFHGGKHNVNDYLASLDCDVMTTSAPSRISSLKFEVEDCHTFPFSNLSIHSNDPNLSNFLQSLESKIENSKLINSYSAKYLNKLPQEISHLILDDRSTNLFKDMSLYHYMASCYYNMIPPEQYLNSHYSYILNLNLMKNFEAVDKETNTRRANESMMQVRLDKLEKSSDQPILPYTPNSISSYAHSVFTSKSFDDHDYGLADGLSGSDAYTADFTSVIHFSRTPPKSFIGNIVSKFRSFRELGSKGKESQLLLEDAERYYDGSINEGNIDDEYSFYNRHAYDMVQEQYPRDYDYVLTYAYFALTCLSILISLVEVGIVYDVYVYGRDDTQIVLQDNAWLIYVLILGIILSIFLSMASVSLNFQRYFAPPTYHALLVWTGFLIVFSCSTWSAMVLFNY